MDQDRIIEQVSWITQSKMAPQPITQEYKERQYRFFENYVHFLQDNGFTTTKSNRRLDPKVSLTLLPFISRI